MKAGKACRLIKPTLSPGHGDQVHYLPALTGGFQRWVRTRELCSSTHSAICPLLSELPIPLSTEQSHFSGSAQTAPQGGAPPGPMGATHPPPSSHYLTLLPSPCNYFFLYSGSLSTPHHTVNQRGQWKTMELPSSLGVWSCGTEERTCQDKFWVR